ncbi:hypothetical protein Ddc_15465 [Ditylenchus destructor]|nr:hypothetical protein Ddc_15465 [Ditylenchus destructor]
MPPAIRYFLVVLAQKSMRKPIFHVSANGPSVLGIFPYEPDLFVCKPINSRNKEGFFLQDTFLSPGKLDLGSSPAGGHKHPLNSLRTHTFALFFARRNRKNNGHWNTCVGIFALANASGVLRVTTQLGRNTCGIWSMCFRKKLKWKGNTGFGIGFPGQIPHRMASKIGFENLELAALVAQIVIYYLEAVGAMSLAK